MASALPKVPPVAVNAASVETPAYKDRAPPASTVAVCAVAVDASFESNPRDRAAEDGVAWAPKTAEPVVLLSVANNK